MQLKLTFVRFDGAHSIVYEAFSWSDFFNSLSYGNILDENGYSFGPDNLISVKRVKG